MILFSGGEDSLVMLHLALKAFAPAALPEVLEYRDRTVARHNLRLHVASVQDYIELA